MWKLHEYYELVEKDNIILTGLICSCGPSNGSSSGEGRCCSRW